LAIVVFVLVGVVVSVVVDLAATRAEQSARSAAEAEVLSSLAVTALTSSEPLASLTTQARRVFGAASVTFQEVDAEGVWHDVAGDVPGGEGSRTEEPTGDGGRLVVIGRPLSGSDVQLLRAFASQAGAVRRTERLQHEADASRAAEAGDRVRTALLSAVGHDLRTPLATIKASASTLLDGDLALSAADQHELLVGVEAAADSLTRLVANLLDVSRLATGAVTPVLSATAIDSIVASAVDSLAPDSEVGRLRVELPDQLPNVYADAALTERILALVAANAVSHAGSADVVIGASCLGDRMEIRVVDRGPGLDDVAKERSFQPFQRLGDDGPGAGLGLGLAVARGLAEAQGGGLEAEDTPGGGLTMVLSLPLAPR
jgi:two-component system sensor histidine kinase KdpD